MAMKVYSRQVEQAAPQAAQPPGAAFGGGIAEAAQGLGVAVQDAGQLIAQRALELQQREDARKTLEAETNFRKDMDVLLYDTEKGLTNRKLSAASGVTTAYDQEVAALKQKYLQDLPGVTQKEQFGIAADGHIQAGRGLMLKHETAEIRAGEELTVTDSLNKNAADVLRDPSGENLARQIANSTGTLQAFGASRGMTAEQIAAKATTEAGRLAASAVAQSLANNDVAGAQALFDQYKDQIGSFSPETSLKLQAAIKTADLQARDATIKKLITDAAALHTDDSLAALISQAGPIIDGQAKYKVEPDVLEMERESTVGAIVTNAAATAIAQEKEKGIAKAQAWLDKYKDQMDAPTAVKLQAVIEQAGFTTKLDNLWETEFSTTKYKLEDGVSYNKDAIQARLQEQGYSGDELEKAKEHVFQLANEDEAYTNAARNARQKSFLDTIAGIRMDPKGTKAQALAVLKTAGFGDYDRLLNQNLIEEWWKPAELKRQTNIGVYAALKEGINKGTVRRADIDDAYKKGLLSDSHWEKLFDLLTTKRTQEQRTEAQEIDEYIDQRAKELYKKTEDRDKFKFYYGQQTEGKSLTQVMDMIGRGQEKVKGGTKWVVDYQDQEKANQTWTKYYDQLNPQVIEALKLNLGAVYKTQIVTSAELVMFEKDIGGLNLKTANAIQSLYYTKKPITPANIKAVLAKYPNGKIPGTPVN